MLRTLAPLIGALGGFKMCLNLFLGSTNPLPEREENDLNVGPLRPSQSVICRWFATPHVQVVGAHTGCSCGFPSVRAETIIEPFEGLWADNEERIDDLRSVTALIDLLREALKVTEQIELFPVWEGEEESPPKGRIEWSLHDLVPERVLFNEGYLYVVRKQNRPAPKQSA